MQNRHSIESPAWRILGASVTGTGHLKRGLGCDDAHVYDQLASGALLLAVADGAGSASRSAEGAARAVQVALQAGKTLLTQQAIPTDYEQWIGLLKSLLRTVRASLEELASSNSVETTPTVSLLADGQKESPKSLLSQFATTFLLVLASDQWVAVAQIGDGAVIALDAEGGLWALTTPEHGEYINETSFITEADYLERAQLKALTMDMRGIALLTDGLQMLALDMHTNAPYAPFFMPLFEFVARRETTEVELQTFLASERVCSRTDDDKTLVLAVRT